MQKNAPPSIFIVREYTLYLRQSKMPALPEMKPPERPSHQLQLEGVKENNLKDISLTLPHDRLTVITGYSGSGKSSLAFSTIYAEGQRRYIETFSPYTRQFFDKVKKPDLVSAENVRPAIAIQQRTRIRNSRSTVGSMTGINDYLRVLWSNISSPMCPECDRKLVRWTPAKLTQHYMRSSNTISSIIICAPITYPEDEVTFSHEVSRLLTLGYSRYLDPATGKALRFDSSPPPFAAGGVLLIALDRFNLLKQPSTKTRRYIDSFNQALELGRGECVIHETDHEQRCALKRYATAYQCMNDRCEADNLAVPTPRPSLFSFNHPLGACPDCRGFGNILALDPELCVPDPTLTIKEGALHCWAVRSSGKEQRRLLKYCQTHGIPIDVQWRKLSSANRDSLFNERSRQFTGVIPWFERLERKAYKMHVRVYLSRYRSQFTCETCNGGRLNAQSNSFKVDGLSLPDLWSLPIAAVLTRLREIRSSFDTDSLLPLDELFHPLESRLSFMTDLGLPYLTLDRQARTLSGGETQRVNLATALGSGLVSSQFVLDEPSVGLHPRDTGRLIRSIEALRDAGNSVVVVEHDLDCIMAADYIVELGPEAGVSGGQIMYSGSTGEWSAEQIAKSLPVTGIGGGTPTGKNALQIVDADLRNLKKISTSIPINSLTCITGVSGSGKSTLVDEVLMKAYEDFIRGIRRRGRNRVNGFQHFDQVLLVDQSPLARSPRANIATYSKIWNVVRSLLAESDSAQVRRFTKSTFSFNVDAGRCNECKGAGFIREDMQFLSDVYIPCEACLGKRFQNSVLEVSIDGRNVDDFLQMTALEASSYFQGNTTACTAAENLCALGLGHLRLGHPLSELSGGEAQRLKLIPLLSRSSRGTSLLIFDEPTTGLHLHDVQNLITLLVDLKERGHTVVCVEHNPTLILAADRIIDLGPEGGELGGELVFEGTPLSLLKKKGKTKSHTVTFLKQFYNEQKQKAGTAPVSLAAARRERESRSLIIRGAREHNLKDIDVTIPLGEVVAITGVSGSGKSTIAKDIVYAEGQRRYLDCLSPYTRQFIKELKKPDINEILNIPPTVCVYQHTFQPSRRSTIATMSEIYNYLRLLFAKVGVQHCPDHPGEVISPLSLEAIAAIIRKGHSGGLRLLAPIIKHKKGNHDSVLQRAIDSEIHEVRVDGIFASPAHFLKSLARNKTHSIEYTVATLSAERIDDQLLIDAIKECLLLGSGEMVLHCDDSDTVFSTSRTCPVCQRGFFRPDPEDLSYNSKRGACEHCSGSGLHRDKTCPRCSGTRLGEIGRNLRISGLTIHEFCQLSALALKQQATALQFESHQRPIAQPILRELLERLNTLIAMGIDYLPLARECQTLSNGELQRLRLATAIGTPLTGAMYIFDEPSAGLHPDDKERVVDRLCSLQDKGNSLLLIDHDRDTILRASHVIDVGPRGGSEGGEIVYAGPMDSFLSCKKSLTAQELASSRQSIVTSKQNPKEVVAPVEGQLTVHTATCNNISKLSTTLPLGQLVVFAGVSGAGKSSLVNGCIATAIGEGECQANRYRINEIDIATSVPIDRLLSVDQKPIGRTSRSVPASYLGIWDHVRKLFASTVEAKSRGWTGSFFSFNTGKGRCLECKGQGVVKLEMNFLADACMSCESCEGRRFNSEANSVQYAGLTISDVLELTFDEARVAFANHKKIHLAAHQACELGLGYLTLGQPSSSLSGGESQRLKLVSELSSRRSGHTIYILDEPTTGLHRSDVRRLLNVLGTLVARGNTVYVIEHDADVLAASDYIIELGPGAGEKGGEIIFQGTPPEIIDARTPWSRIFRDGSTPPEPSRSCSGN